MSTTVGKRGYSLFLTTSLEQVHKIYKACGFKVPDTPEELNIDHDFWDEKLKQWSPICDVHGNYGLVFLEESEADCFGIYSSVTLEEFKLVRETLPIQVKNTTEPLRAFCYVYYNGIDDPLSINP